jgi:monovalent cation:H+ antiporter, CPA1 family
MGVNDIFAATIVLASLFAYINNRWIKWPATIGVMALALMSSLLLVVAGKFFPARFDKVVTLVASIDFQKLLMEFMLSFLLFAGAVHMNARDLKKEKVPVIVLSTAGTLISTILVGVLSWFLFGLFGIRIEFIYCLLFGAFISPTDPIAVLAILKDANLPSSLGTKISGESLFNDGVAVVLFVGIEEIIRSGSQHIDLLYVIKLFVQEVMGGVLFGAILGYTGFLALRSIDNYKVEILITVAIVTGGYSIASHLHTSGPLAMVVAGLIIGNKVKDEAMSGVTQDYLSKFWELIDEILNAILFLLIGMEMLVIKIHPVVLIIGSIMIIIVILARLISVAFSVNILRRRIVFEPHVVALLTLGGLRGGLSVALALSLTSAMHKDEFVLITYIVVVFSILVQGLMIGKVAGRLQRNA